MYLEKNRKASLRIHHNQRMKKNAFIKIYARNLCCYSSVEEAEEKSWEEASRIKDYMKVCSCHMCGNPRRSNIFKGKENLTIQERIALDKMHCETY